MLYRKIEMSIYEHLTSGSDKVLVVTGARQVGKSYIIGYVARKLFKHVIEINFIEDANGPCYFRDVRSTEDFYLIMSSLYGDRMGKREDTIIFLDEIQKYPQFLTMLKFLREESRFSYIASGSLLGVSLKSTVSVPVGSIEILKMYPLDFEEFLIANEVGKDVIDFMRESFRKHISLPAGLHERLMNLFRRYLLVGGMPDVVNTYIDTHNIVEVRKVQHSIHELYVADASQYDEEHKLKIKRMYEMLPSLMENQKKRIIFKNVEDRKGARAANFEDDLDYLISSGIALETTAVSNPKFPLAESMKKNLLKLYMNDVGLLTALLYRNNVRPILNDEESINLGSVYETVVAMELSAHGNTLHYYDNKSHGEVDFLIDDFQTLSVAPIEVKSGKDYKVHSALNRFLSTKDYNIHQGYVLSNSGKVEEVEGIVYMPIYNVAFFEPDSVSEEDMFI
ncbi:MAG: AAA family ATPase [Muribaculaceae bacterium]|nr:AAA family ATPase [Muribaculaceae bacterium]